MFWKNDFQTNIMIFNCTGISSLFQIEHFMKQGVEEEW